MAPRILVVDDEPQLQKAVGRRLERDGYEVHVAEDGEVALDSFDSVRPHLVVLDLMLPKLDGFEVCAVIRRDYSTPIIILSARGDELDKVAGFQLGVDDYLTKPFSLSELSLRVAAVLRRSREPMEKRVEKGVLHFEGLEVDRSCRRVLARSREIHLTQREFDLLWLLASNPAVVLTRERLLDAVWNSSFEGDLANVTVMVSRLREKLECATGNRDWIQTVRGVGYAFSSPE